MINSTDNSDGRLNRLHNPLYGTTPAELLPVGNILHTVHSGGTEPTYEGKVSSEEEANNQCHLPSNAERNRTEKSNVYHFAGRAGDEDYEDPEMDGIENVYHILEGPTTERGEYHDNEANDYEIPVTKRN